MRLKYLMIGLVVLGAALALAACGGTAAPEATPCPVAECPEAAPCPDCPTCEECPVVVVDPVPYEEEWVNSPHNDTAAEAFVHWNEDDPAEVPTNCAKCHSTTGYQDFLGADGSEAEVVDAAVPVGETVKCEACHNTAADALSEVTFPSGVTSLAWVMKRAAWFVTRVAPQKSRSTNRSPSSMPPQGGRLGGDEVARSARTDRGCLQDLWMFAGTSILTGNILELHEGTLPWY